MVFFFALKVNVNPSKHEYKTCIFVVFVCSLSPMIINYACPSFQTTCALALMFTLQHKFELSTLPSIPSIGHVGGLYAKSCFIIIRQDFFPVLFFQQNQLKFSYDRVQVFHRHTFLSYRQGFIFEMIFMNIKENGQTFHFKSRLIQNIVLIYVFNLLLVKKFLDKKITKINDIIPLTMYA